MEIMRGRNNCQPLLFLTRSHIEKSVCNVVVVGRTHFRQVSTTLWCPGTTCMSFPARSSHFVHYCCSLAASLCSVSDFQIETCIFFFCRRQLYFQANQGCGSRRFGVLEKFQFIMKCIKCLNQTVYKYSTEVLLALKNSLFTLPFYALWDGFPNCIHRACTASLE